MKTPSSPIPSCATMVTAAFTILQEWFFVFYCGIISIASAPRARACKNWYWVLAQDKCFLLGLVTNESGRNRDDRYGQRLLPRSSQAGLTTNKTGRNTFLYVQLQCTDITTVLMTHSLQQPSPAVGETTCDLRFVPPWHLPLDFPDVDDPSRQSRIKG